MNLCHERVDFCCIVFYNMAFSFIIVNLTLCFLIYKSKYLIFQLRINAMADILHRHELTPVASCYYMRNNNSESELISATVFKYRSGRKMGSLRIVCKHTY